MQNPAAYIVVFSLLTFGLLVLGYALFRWLYGKYAPKVTVKAQVTDKHRLSTFSKARGNACRYVATFTANGRKHSFDVSEFSYRGYRVGERGQLTYQGTHLIDFH